MGIAAPQARSTLADALNLRDWRIYHAPAERLIPRARALYAQEPSVLGLDACVYALDSTTIDLYLSLFDWVPLRSTKAAIKLHTLPNRRRALQEPLEDRAILQMEQATPAHQALPGHQRERSKEPDMVRHRYLCPDCHRQERTQPRCLALHLSTDPVGLDLQKNRDFMRPSALSPQDLIDNVR